MKIATLHVVIVTMNSSKYIYACLSSLFQALPAGVDTTVMVVDNCSVDDTARIVLEEFPQVRLEVNERPCGLSVNNNRGIRARTADAYLILNPDTRLFHDSLQQLIETMQHTPDAGIVGPKLIFPDGRVQESVRRFPTLPAVLVRGLGLDSISFFRGVHEKYIMADWDHETTARVDWVLGACLLVRGVVFETIGLMDEGYRLYYEEIDYCYRAKRAGWNTYYFANARVVHDYQRESASGFSWKTVWHIRSILRFFRKTVFSTA